MKRFYFILTIFILSCAGKENNKIPYEEGMVETGDGAKLFYQKVGSGSTKVILPLGLFLYDDFKSLANNDRTLIFYDVRNRGRSAHITDSSRIGIWQDVRDLETVRKHFGAEKVSLVGWSYLGMMVMLYASQYPDHVERIIQIGPAPLKWDTQFPTEHTNTDPSPIDTLKVRAVESARIEALDKRDPKKFSAMWYNAYVFPQLFSDRANLSRFRERLLKTTEPVNEFPDNFLWHIKHHFGGSIQNMNSDSLWVEIKKIKLPVLTVHGTKDRNAVYGSGRQWAHELPNARLLTIPDAAHLPWLEKGEEVFQAVDIFLEGKWPDKAEKIN